MRLEELSRLLRDVDPAVVLVNQPVLDRVVRNVTGVTWAVWQVPHNHCLVVRRDVLYKYVDQEEVIQPPDHSVPTVVIVLPRPNNDQLAGKPADLLLRYWRLLFHAAVHRELDHRLEGLTPAGLRERIDALGPAAFEEARNVLVQDGSLTETADDRAAYVEFAAYFFELRFFSAPLLGVCFPSLPPAADVEAVLARDVDGAGLFRRTRLPGAPDPSPRTDDQSDESHDFFEQLSRNARRAAKAGDTVGAAIMHTRAARVAPAALTATAQDAARQDVYHLINRLQSALGLTDDEVTAWRRVLPALLDKADQGSRPVEAAILYDLQRACLDHEQTIYALDVGEWVVSLGHKPVRRKLDSQRFVRVPAQLRAATRRLTAARLSDADRQALGALLRDALNRAEDRLRAKFRPVLTEVLHDAGLRPTNLPEQVALGKTVEELLDRISSTGFLTFADLRDALARGQMKLPDLTGPNEYLGRDPLLRLDKRLASLLDGVYRRAESYTRILEALNALTFGTSTGRWLTRNVALPFLGSFLLAQFVWMIVFDARVSSHRPEAAAADIAQATGLPAPPNTIGPAEENLSFFGGWNQEWWFHLGWVLLGGFFLLTIQSASVRHALAMSGRAAYRVARFLFWELPHRIWGTPWVRAVLASLPVQFAKMYALYPAALTALFMLAFPSWLWGAGWGARVATYVAALFVVNSRPGRRVGELLLYKFVEFLHLIRSFPAVLRWINDIFRDMVAAVDWVLARGEDWLRLRGPGGPVAVVTRVVAGLFWMPFAFLTRFYTVVLIEPMINPLKLPLTLLFAKFVYPLLLLSPQILVRKPGTTLGYDSPLVADLAPVLPYAVAFLLVMGTIWLLPDAFTYLFWEMRENWRLFRANRPKGLKPVMVGQQGEAVKGLLHVGFHSGTVPKLFARLRAAEREAVRTDNWRDARTYKQALRGVEEAVRRFIHRELLAVLNPGPAGGGWTGPSLSVGQVHLGTNRIRIELLPAMTGEPAWLEYEDRSGWLVVGWAEPGFLADLSDDAARDLENALVYLYKRAGVDVVREQAWAELPKERTHFDVAPHGLLVWYGPRESTPVLYDLSDPAAELRPLTPDGRRPAHGPVLEARRLVFSRIDLTWSQWVAVWTADPAHPRPRFGPPDFHLTLLPPRRQPPPGMDPIFSGPPVVPMDGAPGYRSVTGGS
jgi:hypothetical protein